MTFKSQLFELFWLQHWKKLFSMWCSRQPNMLNFCFCVLVFHWVSHLITQPIPASRKKPKHYVTHHQPRTGELIQHFCLHTTRVEGPIMSKSCIGSCVQLRQCSSTSLEIEEGKDSLFWGWRVEVRSMHNEHIPCHCLVRIPLPSPMRKHVVLFKKKKKQIFYPWHVCVNVCMGVCVCI